MKKKPTIEALQQEENFELIAEVEHVHIKEFVIEQMLHDRKLIPAFMIYQLLMVLLGTFFLTRAIVLAFRGFPLPLLVSAGTLVFCFTLLIVIHELLHGAALKITGAPKITYGGWLKKFMFYAEADQHVLNRPQFFLVAFTPLVVVQLITLAGIVIWFSHPAVYFFLILMSVHSLFCAGDIGLASIFFRFPGRNVFTYDNREAKKSYYYVEKQP